jgi:hypothetical protein
MGSAALPVVVEVDVATVDAYVRGGMLDAIGDRNNVPVPACIMEWACVGNEEEEEEADAEDNDETDVKVTPKAFICSTTGPM